VDDFAQLTPLGGGWSGETFVASAGGERSVVRIFADPRHHPEAAQIQEALLRLVRGLVPVPRVLEAKRPDAATGMPALLVTELVDGVRGDLLLPTLDDVALRAVGRAFGEVARTLSRMPQPRAGTFADAALRVDPRELHLPDWVEAHAERLAWSDDDLAALGEVAEEATGLLGEVDRVSLVHSDLNPKNLLVDPSTLAVVAVLDWEFAHAGHPLTDLGNLVRFDRAAAYVCGVLEGFGDDDYGDDTLDAARSADLAALVELASRREANPVAARAHDRLLAIARARDVHAL
jgi:aminoglycoside phosphotransferase (APT) family kinase protein